jgi:hypothetical protein
MSILILATKKKVGSIREGKRETVRVPLYVKEVKEGAYCEVKQDDHADAVKDGMLMLSKMAC